MQPSLLAILLGLGFSLALLAMMIGLRIFWVARKNSTLWRDRRNAPSHIASLEAERDRLKAELAMLARRFELSEQEHKSRHAERMAEIARYRHRLEQASLKHQK